MITELLLTAFEIRALKVRLWITVNILFNLRGVRNFQKV